MSNSDDTTVLVESKEYLMKLLHTVKDKSEKAHPNLNHVKKKKDKSYRLRRSTYSDWETITWK